MRINEIIGLTRGTIKVKIDNKEIFITGELTMDKFYADLLSIKKWEPPFENDVITESIKKDIVSSIERETKNAEIPIVFD
jgi:hypothetical protein